VNAATSWIPWMLELDGSCGSGRLSGCCWCCGMLWGAVVYIEFFLTPSDIKCNAVCLALGRAICSVVPAPLGIASNCFQAASQIIWDTAGTLLDV